MSKIARYQGNVRAFASDAQGMERTVFGGTNQADDLTSQITASFLRGWGIVGASEHPSLEDFNAAMYAMSQFIAYQHQMGVPEWHAEQEYHIGSICTHNGESYQSLQNANIGSQPPSAKWTPVLTSKNGLANLGLDVALSNKQPLSDTLTKLATLGPQTDADQVLFFSGKNVPAVTALTLAGRQFISKESVPDMLQYLTLGDGTGRLLGVQAFSISGTYVKSAGVKKIIVEAVGGGGASGNLSATASNNAGISSVGSPGCYAKAYYYENIPSTVAVTIGSGGAEGTGPGGSGGDGGQTSFGTLLVCPGGKGSQQIQQVPPFSGGSTGEAGQPTGTGILFHSVSRSPSCAVMGLTQDQSIGLENTISTLLGVYGKGGTGAYNPANSPARNGNDGTQGYMLIWEYQ